MKLKVPASEIVHENGHRFINGKHTGLRTLSGMMVCLDCGALRRPEGNPSCIEMAHRSPDPVTAAEAA